MIVPATDDDSFESLGLTQIRVSLDALSISLTAQESNQMLGEMIDAVGRQGCDVSATKGQPWRDFQQTERYGLSTLNEGAQWFRKFNPQQPAPTLGEDYESWEVMGPASRILADVLKSAPVHVGRASRLDVAFDFACEPDLWPPAIEEAISAYCEEHGFHIHHQGKRDTRTVYVGSPKSERRVRIYRHDLAHGGGLPILRVEVELRRKFAAEVWECWWPNGGPGLSLCAGHVHQLTGHVVVADELTYPAPDVGRDVDLLESAAHACVQYGGTFYALLKSGVDLADLIRAVRRLPLSVGGDRVRKHKIGRLMASVAHIAPRMILRGVINTIRLRRGLDPDLRREQTGPSVAPRDQE